MVKKESIYVAAGSEKMHYLRAGSGSKLLLAFHGYGNDASLFSPFYQYLGGEYTILSFDLPHHGKSAWNADVHLTPKDLAAMVAGLMQQNGVDKVSLMGYSMGGRVCMGILEQLPQQVDKMLLMATDGLVINPWYRFFTGTMAGRKLFRMALGNPERFDRLIVWLQDRKIIDANKHKFARYYIQSAGSREFLLRAWPSLRHIVPRIGTLKALIKKYRIQVTIYMGREDRIMPPVFAEDFKKGLDTVHLYVLDRGHRVFDSYNAGEIAQSLL